MQARRIGIGCQQLECAIEPRTGFEQERKVEGKYRDVLGSNTFLEFEAEVRRPGNFLDDRIDRNQAKIVNSASNLCGGRGSDHATNYLSLVGQCPISEIRHHFVIRPW